MANKELCYYWHTSHSTSVALYDNGKETIGIDLRGW
jgi:hypothetical protein